MVQGMTLEALLADLGDALNKVALKGMLAGYGILARVRKVERLLLLRAFPRGAFEARKFLLFFNNVIGFNLLEYMYVYVIVTTSNAYTSYTSTPYAYTFDA